MINIELRNFDLELAQLLIMRRCIDLHPNADRKQLCKLLNMSRSTYYRRIGYMESDQFIDDLLRAGYNVSFIKTKTIQNITP